MKVKVIDVPIIKDFFFKCSAIFYVRILIMRQFEKVAMIEKLSFSLLSNSMKNNRFSLVRGNRTGFLRPGYMITSTQSIKIYHYLYVLK